MAVVDAEAIVAAASIRRRNGVLRMARSIAPPPWIATMWIQVGQTWASMFEFLESSSTPDDDADCATISAANVASDIPATASSLEVRIPTALAIQLLRGYTLANTLGLIGRN